MQCNDSPPVSKRSILRWATEQFHEVTCVENFSFMGTLYLNFEKIHYAEREENKPLPNCEQKETSKILITVNRVISLVTTESFNKPF